MFPSFNDLLMDFDYDISFNPASLFLASSTSAIPGSVPGSASFQRERNFS